MLGCFECFSQSYLCIASSITCAIHHVVKDRLDKRMANWEKFCLLHYCGKVSFVIMKVHNLEIWCLFIDVNSKHLITDAHTLFCSYKIEEVVDSILVRASSKLLDFFFLRRGIKYNTELCLTEYNFLQACKFDVVETSVSGLSGECHNCNTIIHTDLKNY